MSTKTKFYLGMVIGSTIGSVLPVVWGADFLSVSSVLLSGLGGFMGLVIAYKIEN